MTRSSWKLPFINPLVYKISAKEKVTLLKPRNILISKGLLGKRIGVHNGQWFAVKDMVPALLGCRLGEMSAPRKTDIDLHIKKKKKKKKK